MAKHTSLYLGLVLWCGTILISVAVLLLGSAPLAQADSPTAQSELRVCASGCVYTTVQAAIDAAAPGDVVQIAGGIYTGTQNVGGVQQIAHITKTLTLRGGYSPDFGAWDPQIYTTTLDAEGQGRVIYASGAFSVTLDGLRLRNGFASNVGGGVYAQSTDLRLTHGIIQGSRVTIGSGIGLYISGGSLTMEDSVIQENYPTVGGYDYYDGGGLLAANATVVIRNSQILSNTAGYGGYTGLCRGGGIFLDHSDAVIQGVTFRNNTATTGAHGRGGGLSTVAGTLTLRDSLFENNVAAALDGGAGGGAYLRTDHALVDGNEFTRNTASRSVNPTGSGGGLDIGNSWENTTTIWGVAVTDNLFQENVASDGGGMVAKTAAVLTIEDNRFVGNHNSGLSLVTKSDTGAPSEVTMRANRFEANYTGRNGGGLLVYGAANLLFNEFVSNTASGSGGAIYQGEITRFDSASALYDGNVMLGNAAADGGGLYIRTEYSANLLIDYRNLALLDNTASGTGSGLCVRRYASTPIDFRHLTVAGNSGGDGSMIYVVMGHLNFTNTILYNGAIGVKMNSGPVTLDHTLRHDVITPTLAISGWGLTDTSPVNGDPALAVDGYHLTRGSAAVDAGIDLGVTDDIDGAPRPLGTAPDLGADESTYSLSETGLQVSKLAGTPTWRVYYTGINVPPSTILEQGYLIPYVYSVADTAPQVTDLAIQDTFPSELDLISVANPNALFYTLDGDTLSWSSQSPLAPGAWGWVGMTGRSDAVAAGQTITNSALVTYSLSNGQTYTVPLTATVQVPERPIYAPTLITPLDGEMCLENGDELSAIGLAGAGMTVRLYEDGGLKAQAVANASGEFTLTWTSALTQTHSAITLYTVACTPDELACSEPSRTVHLEYPEADWCPQRSYWEGYAYGIHHIFYFRNDEGRYASNDFVLPGVRGFSETQMHLYSCCDHNDTNPFKVTADNVVYQTPSVHDGRWWTFDIGMAHNVIVESQCQGGGTPPPPKKETHGTVLIDPDGFIFDASKGGQYDALTGIFTPVQALSGITVTAYVSVTEWNAWVPWPAHLYNNQVNPQVTGEDGYFAFFTPPGFYYLEAVAPAEGSEPGAYQTWRSPVIQVITEIVHVNIPLTPWIDAAPRQIVLTPDGPSVSTITVPVGASVEWLSSLDESATADDLSSLAANPMLHVLSARDPLTDVLGFDSGMLASGRAYRRRFIRPGTFLYTDGAGNSGEVDVQYAMHMPVVRQP